MHNAYYIDDKRIIIKLYKRILKALQDILNKIMQIQNTDILSRMIPIYKIRIMYLCL